MRTIQIGVVIATKGRPLAASRVLRLLERQTVQPVLVTVSATGPEDVESGITSPLDLRFVFGSAGTCIQRNRGLKVMRGACDVVVFFDDDFVPAPDWLARCAELFASDPTIVGASGALLRDGAQTEEVPWEEAQSLIDGIGPRTETAPPLDCTDLYGCNMAYRMSAVGESGFDERLVLYGWMEDKDFSRAIARKGRLVESGSMMGVHLGMKSGRMPGKKYGYSQVVNPWYLHKKGMMSAGEAGSKILKPMLMNAARAMRPEKHIDRLGRLIGNLLALGHLLVGRCRPETAAEL